MGTSHPETKDWIVEKILSNDIKSILDVGAGSGTYYHYLLNTRYNGYIDAVEVWNPYIDEFKLKQKYRRVYNQDIREFDRFNHDLVIFGDILEHMSEEDALDVWKNASKYCKYGVIAIPIIEYHQHAINNNPYEEHIVDDWNHDRVMSTFPHIIDSWQGQIAGAYWAKFR